MSFIAAVLILNLDTADAFIAFSNLLNKPCQMAFFRVDHGLVSIPSICVLLHSQVADRAVFSEGKGVCFPNTRFRAICMYFLTILSEIFLNKHFFKEGRGGGPAAT